MPDLQITPTVFAGVLLVTVVVLVLAAWSVLTNWLSKVEELRERIPRRDWFGAMEKSRQSQDDLRAQIAAIRMRTETLERERGEMKAQLAGIDQKVTDTRERAIATQAAVEQIARTLAGRP